MGTARADDRLDAEFRRILQTVITAAHANLGSSKASHALLGLLIRCAHGWQSIRTLRVHSPDADTFTIDAAVILRCIFDAYLQAHLMFRDSAKREELGTLYLEFAHIDRFKAESKTMRHDNELTKRLKQSPHRAAGTKRLQQEYDRVKANYYVEKRRSDGTVKAGPDVRDKWYKGGLHDLAVAAGKVDEYDTFITPFSGCVHSGAFAVQAGPPLNGESIGLLAAMLVARVMLMNIENSQLPISDVDMKDIRVLDKGLLEPAD